MSIKSLQGCRTATDTQIMLCNMTGYIHKSCRFLKVVTEEADPSSYVNNGVRVRKMSFLYCAMHHSA